MVPTFLIFELQMRDKKSAQCAFLRNRLNVRFKI